MVKVKIVLNGELRSSRLIKVVLSALRAPEVKKKASFDMKGVLSKGKKTNGEMVIVRASL